MADSLAIDRLINWPQENAENAKGADILFLAELFRPEFYLLR
jgi:hypothetical protein